MSSYDPNDMNAVISSLHTKLDAMAARQVENGLKLDSALQRISALEAWKLWIYGMAAGISAVVAGMVAAVKWLFTSSNQ